MDEILFTRQINERQTDAFCRLFKDFFDSLLCFATGYVECKEVAEDVVQEVFVDIWEGKRKFRSYNSLKTFLYTSVRNACVDWLRHQRVEKKYADVMRRETSDDEEDFAYKVMREEIYRELFAVIEELQTAGDIQVSHAGKIECRDSRNHGSVRVHGEDTESESRTIYKGAYGASVLPADRIQVDLSKKLKYFLISDTSFGVPERFIDVKREKYGL